MGSEESCRRGCRARCSGADAGGSRRASMALGGLCFDCSTACVPCNPLLLFWQETVQSCGVQED
uniref:Calnexin n=1 Tax=Myotis myotis TaxID=51298 RepID=A0A7J7XE96_MYOMY|nr:calnexin [Myotis myotis]